MPDLPVPFDEQVTPWRAWSPAEARDRLRLVRVAGGAPLRWAVAGGWAVDLHLGHETRPHSDLEITVVDRDVPALLAAFTAPHWRWVVPHEGMLHATDSPALGQTHQVWLWSEDEQAFVLDVFREPHGDATWVCRRDERITLPWDQVVERTPDGVPYLAVETVLLFKAKHLRPKDVGDLESVLPTLDADRRRWLREAVEQVHPGHAWSGLLRN
ncbi:nucleotidyltransferase domain-containing protein [Pseudonocardia sp. GCM10023141]|uniref:nucleotidyltransferase domain-containing protein n=1 Tax=Pseudonocardia sp. GCM10023141 TaxID=3252653 RepID=UPI003616AB96